MSTFSTFENLEAWKAAREFRMFVSRQVLPSLVQRKEFSLADQLKRSSRSVTHNIAEGYGRFHFRDNYKFCSNARGSLCEALDQLLTSCDDDLIADETFAEGRTLYDHTLKVLNGYMAYLQKAARTTAPQ